MPDIRLVALDLDGTVFNDEKEITPRTLEAIRAAIAKGVDVIPATGRVASGVNGMSSLISSRLPANAAFATSSKTACLILITFSSAYILSPFP